MPTPKNQVRLLAVSALVLILAACQITPAYPSGPSATPTPVAASALESPLEPVAGAPDLVLFQRAGDSDEKSFAVQFDQNLWEYGNTHVFGPALGHHQLAGCTLVLHGWRSDDTDVLRTVSLAGREWVVSAIDSGSILYNSPPFGFFLTNSTFDSLVEDTRCQQAGEQVIATFAPLPTSATPVIQIIGGSRATDEPWITAYSQKGGFSVRHPASWDVTEHKRGALELSPPAGQRQDRIWLGYLDFEKPEEADLQSWMEQYIALWLDMPRTPSFSPVRLNVIDPLGSSQHLYNEEPPAVLRREYYITHGRLVLQVGHVSQRTGQEEVLRRVADSIVFDAAAPANLTELYYPEPPKTSTGYLTIEAYQQWMHDMNVAGEALNFRSQIGEEPTALLATMSERARAEYERLMLNAADHIKIMDRRRAFEAALSPLPTPAPAQLSAGSEMNWVRYQSAGDDDRERFEIRFDSTLWEFADTPAYGHHLIHHHLIDCTLALRNWDEVAIDTRGTVPLAGRDWTVSLAASGSVLFHSPPYSFFLSGNRNASPLENPHCLQAAKGVIDTLTVLPPDPAAQAQIISGSSAHDEP
ncbi:MAG: hypothetical protein DCC55_33225 [Chloroflexi bacterium]|nr:MAG: hypothetical protein DCC55_33225 [Chloroflexota bacterium]